MTKNYWGEMADSQTIKLSCVVHTFKNKAMYSIFSEPISHSQMIVNDRSLFSKASSEFKFAMLILSKTICSYNT